MRKEPDLGIRGMEYFIGGTGNPCAMMNFSVCLKEAVDPITLKEALNRTLKRNWAFRTTIKLNGDGSLKYTDNNKEAEVYHDDGQIFRIGSDECNGYLFVLLYDDKNIKLRCFHGVTDGRGMSIFIQALLYNYYTLKGENIAANEHMMISDNPVDEREYDLCIEDALDPGAEGEQQRAAKVTPFLIPAQPDRTNRDKGLTKFVRYECDSKDILQLSKQKGGGLTGLIIGMVAKAIDNVYGVDDNAVVCRCTVDKRKLFDSRALSNFSGSVLINTTADNIRQDIGDLSVLENKMLKSANTRAYHASNVKQAALMGEQMRALPVRAVAEATAKKEVKAEATFTLSNLGAVSFGPEIDAHIEDFSVSSPIPLNANSTGILAYGINDRFCITSEQYYDSDDLMKEISSLLALEGVNGRITCSSWEPSDILNYDHIGSA